MKLNFGGAITSPSKFRSVATRRLDEFCKCPLGKTFAQKDIASKLGSTSCPCPLPNAHNCVLKRENGLFMLTDYQCHQDDALPSNHHEYSPRAFVQGGLKFLDISP